MAPISAVCIWFITSELHNCIMPDTRRVYLIGFLYKCVVFVCWQLDSKLLSGIIVFSTWHQCINAQRSWSDSTRVEIIKRVMFPLFYSVYDMTLTTAPKGFWVELWLAPLNCLDDLINYIISKWSEFRLFSSVFNRTTWAKKTSHSRFGEVRSTSEEFLSVRIPSISLCHMYEHISIVRLVHHG